MQNEKWSLQNPFILNFAIYDLQFAIGI